MMSKIGLHKLADVIFGITQKPLYQTCQIFLNLYCSLISNWSIVSGSFFIFLFGFS